MFFQYYDPDTNFDSSRLEYSWSDMSNAQVVLSWNHSIVLHRFTQQDIADEIVYVQHVGDALGRSVIWVTDGLFYSTGVLQIQASGKRIFSHLRKSSPIWDISCLINEPYANMRERAIFSDKSSRNHICFDYLPPLSFLRMHS